MGKLTLGLFFGGRSTEHEVSVITALQAFKHLDKLKYNIIPVYVSKESRFYTNPKFLDLKNYKDIDNLLISSVEVIPIRYKGKPTLVTISSWFNKFIPFDLAFPLFHGSFGEDGSIQGLFEVYQIPYTGFNVLASAVAMDKVISKFFFSSLGLDFAKFCYIKRSDWIKDPKECLNIILQKDNRLKFPLFVKPGNGGSSIGAGKANNEEELSFNIEVAAIYSDKILIEEAFEGVKEVNCSALGYKDVEASVCEMPIASGEILSFEDKYKKGGKGSKGAGMASLSRVIPAPITSKLTDKIQDITIHIFKSLGGCGVARIDYFVDLKREKVYVNEINSPPGSLSFYLWEPAGIKYNELLDKIIQYALERWEDQKKTQYTFNSGLLSQMANSGLKR